MSSMPAPRWRGRTAAFLLLIVTGGVGTQALSANLVLEPALSQMLGRALARNPGLRAAQAAVEAAKAHMRAADRPLYNPELGLDAEQAETRTGTLTLSQSIDWSDKRGGRGRVAAGRLALARAEYAGRRRQLAGELLAALARYRTHLDLDALAERRVHLMRRFLDLALERHAAGDLNQAELDLARLAFTRVGLERARTAADLVEARQDLAAITGNPRHQWPALPGELPPLDPIDIDALVAGSPEVRAAQARLSVARSELLLRRRERRPDPTLGFRAGQERSFRSGRQDHYGLIGLSLSIPLYIRNDYRAEVATAAARGVEAERRLRDVRRRVRARILAAAQRYRLGREAWSSWQRSGQGSLRNRLTLLERLWRIGELSSTDYLVQLDQTLDTRVSALEVRGRLWRAWADWLVSSGQLDHLPGMGGAHRTGGPAPRIPGVKTK